MYRNTYVEINLKNIKENIKRIIEKHNDYKYYFGVVKADCYGHNDIKTVKAIIEGGCNYLAVSSLEEALEIRKKIKDIPILCLGIINEKYIDTCIKNNIDITISNLDYLKKIIDYKNLKVHIKVNTGMNRLGFNNREEINECYEMINDSNMTLQGIYTHIYDAGNEERTNNQYKVFEELTKDIDLSKIPIVHVGASDATINYKKKPYANGCRLGICMYGLGDFNDIEPLPTFSVYSEVIQINNVKEGTVGYSGNYKVSSDTLIAVVSIGYADGIIRKNTGRSVYINNKEYEIVGNICMDMLFVKVDDSVKVHDKVTIIKDIEHLNKIAKHLDTITYEVICSISKRVPRKYKK